MEGIGGGTRRRLGKMTLRTRSGKRSGGLDAAHTDLEKRGEPF